MSSKKSTTRGAPVSKTPTTRHKQCPRCTPWGHPLLLKEESMKPESVQQMKRLMDTRDLLSRALAQYTASINTLKGVLEHTAATLTAHANEETPGQISALREFVARLSHESLGMCAACSALTETLEVLAREVTVHEEHVPAGVS